MLLSHFNIAYWHCTTKTFIFWCKLGRVRLCLNRIKNAAPDSYTRRVELPQKGGATPGAQCYPSRAELTQERRVTSEGWSYLRTVVIPHRSELPQECGVTPGGRNTSEGWSYSTSWRWRYPIGRSYPRSAELPQEGVVNPWGRSYPRRM